MNRFILRILKFSAVLALLIAPLLFFKIGGDSWKYIDNPTASIIEKTRRLESLKSPKLIIVGGSGTFFGLNSETIQKELKLNVVNMAQFAGFGLNFLLEQTKSSIRKGDIVLLSIEYFLKLDMDSEVRDNILKYYPAAAKYFPNVRVSYIDKLRYNFLNNVESIFSFITTPISRRSPVFKHSRISNIYGDCTGYLKYANPAKRTKMGKFIYRFYEGIAVIKKYIEAVHKKGGDVCLIFPPISKTAFSLNGSVFNKYYKELKNIPGNKVLCTPSEMVFADSLFFDTFYHLNKEGRKIRTERVIRYFRRSENGN